jgi:hypothetical protein
MYALRHNFGSFAKFHAITPKTGSYIWNKICVLVSSVRLLFEAYTIFGKYCDVYTHR